MKEIKKIAAGAFTRNSKMLKLAIGGGKKLLFNRDQDMNDKIKNLVSGEVHKLVNELGLMKGPVMKFGQILSLYSSHLLSPELKKILTQLEGQSFYLSFDEVKKNIPLDILASLDFETTPIAAASLGQVHLARDKKSNQTYAVKIQYKGVRKAIENDIKLLKFFIKMSQLIPKEINLSNLFDEVKVMLYQETDYELEAKMMQTFLTLIKNEPNYYIPNVYCDYSNGTIITMDYVDAFQLRDLDQHSINQEERNKLGISFFELFLNEIFVWKMIQTDPNPANYMIRYSEVNKAYQWVLLDFGSCKEISPDLSQMYSELIFSVIENKYDQFTNLLKAYNYVHPEKDLSHGIFKEYFDIISEPFHTDFYDWGSSTILERVIKIAPQLIKEISIFRPPKEIVFIDRKIGGIFFILKMLKTQGDLRSVCLKFKKD